MIKIKIKQSESRNRKPIEKTSIEHTPTKISGFGAADDYTKTSGHDFNPVALPRHGMEEKVEGDNELGYEIGSILDEEGCGCGDQMPSDDGMEFIPPEEETLYEKKDRCYRLAKQKYDVFPSAYASGFIVRCRKGKVAKKKNESLQLEEEVFNFLLEEGTFDKEKSQGLHGWFARKGGKGKSKGWVDCNTCRTNPETGRKTCKSCGRQDGEKRGKYPACRPTPSACTKVGTSKKKSSSRVSWKSKKKKEE